MLHKEMEGKQPSRRPRTRWIDQIRNDVEKWVGKIGNKHKKSGNGRIEMAGDFSV